MKSRRYKIDKDKEECENCSSTDYIGELLVCKFCGRHKCSKCDLGDHVECPSCDGHWV